MVLEGHRKGMPIQNIGNTRHFFPLLRGMGILVPEGIKRHAQCYLAMGMLLLVHENRFFQLAYIVFYVHPLFSYLVSQFTL